MLDAGCGFGVSSILFALMGAQRCDSMDFLDSIVRTFHHLLESFPYQLPVHPAQADAALLPYASASFDVVLAAEAISHIRHFDSFFSKAARVLDAEEPSSSLRDGANWSRARRTRRIWTAFENGPPSQDCHGHTLVEPFVDKRARIIRDAFPAE